MGLSKMSIVMSVFEGNDSTLFDLLDQPQCEVI